MRVLAALVLGVTFLIAAPAQAAAAELAAADEEAALRAAGFTRQGKDWRSACGADATESYSPGTIETVRDLNGDGRPEAVITEGGSYCYGMAGTGYSIVGKQADGGWTLITSGTGIASFLPTTGADGWPDIEIGGPGFCFPVERWNGQEYRLDRHEYEGKACSPQ